MKITGTVLATTMPEESKTHGLTVCGAVYDHDNDRLVRIWPLPVAGKMFRRWNVLEMDASKSRRDHRRESYDLNCDGPRDAHKAITVKGVLPQPKRVDLLNKIGRPAWRAESMAAMSGAKMSLGLIRRPCTEIDIVVAGVEQEDAANAFTRDELGMSYRMRWQDGPGCPVEVQFNAWEIYRAYQNGMRLSDIRDRLRVGSPEHDVLIVLGNMNAVRTRYLAAAVFPLKAEGVGVPSLFSASA